MAGAFSEATPLTRVWSNTAGGADVVSSLAAVVTVMPLYVLAQPEQKPPFPHRTRCLRSSPERSRARRLVARRSAPLTARTAVEAEEGGKGGAASELDDVAGWESCWKWRRFRVPTA